MGVLILTMMMTLAAYTSQAGHNELHKHVTDLGLPAWTRGGVSFLVEGGSSASCGLSAHVSRRYCRGLRMGLGVAVVEDDSVDGHLRLLSMA